MNGRYFGGRQLRVGFWDGVTDYRSGKPASSSASSSSSDAAAVAGGGRTAQQQAAKTSHRAHPDEEEDEDARLDDFGKWLEGDE